MEGAVSFLAVSFFLCLSPFGHDVTRSNSTSHSRLFLSVSFWDRPGGGRGSSVATGCRWTRRSRRTEQERTAYNIAMTQ